MHFLVHFWRALPSPGEIAVLANALTEQAGGCYVLIVAAVASEIYAAV